jgi:hypothetical protein
MKAFKGSILHSDIPVFTIIGNHDRMNWCALPTTPISYSTLIDPYPAQIISYSSPFISGYILSTLVPKVYSYTDYVYYYSFDYGKCRFMCIDTLSSLDPLIRTKGFTKTQYNWINSQLKDDIEYAFMFTHAPAVGFYGTHCILNRNRLISLLSNHECKIKAIFSGHTHKTKQYGKKTKPIGIYDMNNPDEIKESIIQFSWFTSHIITEKST